LVRKNGYEKAKKLIGRRARRSAYAVATALVAVAFAVPALAAAEAADAESILNGTVAPSSTGAHWTRTDRENAEPLPVAELPGLPPGGAGTAAIGGASTGQASAFSGIEIGEAESTLFPNDANGKLFGEFRIPLDESQVKVVKYQCSASVVPSRRGNVILTAAHCLIDRGTGTLATKGSLEFIPGYRNGVGPDGTWKVTSDTGFYETTESWANWTKRRVTAPNEGGDLALVLLEVNRERENVHYGENVEKVVGSLGIAFNQACNQTYTQYGYPAESPYPNEGPILYSLTTPYIGTDTNPAITPKPVKIASDFTRGSSGGPWTIPSSGPPTVLSLTAYTYEDQPGYLYGPYFGEAARKVYVRAAETFVPIGIEETCTALPEIPVPAAPTPAPTPPTPTPEPETTPVKKLTLKVTRVRHRANGSAVLTAKVNAAGMLKLSGAAVRAESLDTPAAGRYRLIVAPKGKTNRRLRQKGRAKVGVKVAFRAAGKTKRVSRKIQLSRRAPDRLVQASRSHSRARPAGATLPR